ncbi:hypothetical protein BU15DRAFT_65692 [Melanogaster broomeanus]|nr:hypothetical protein BU15DRAFT_65692 [Melanogaster broomeanus]
MLNDDHGEELHLVVSGDDPKALNRRSGTDAQCAVNTRRNTRAHKVLTGHGMPEALGLVIIVIKAWHGMDRTGYGFTKNRTDHSQTSHATPNQDQACHVGHITRVTLFTAACITMATEYDENHGLAVIHYNDHIAYTIVHATDSSPITISTQNVQVHMPTPDGSRRGRAIEPTDAHAHYLWMTQTNSSPRVTCNHTKWCTRNATQPP